MRLNAADFNRTIRSVLGPVLREHGFKRTHTSSPPGWARQSGDRYLITWAQNSPPGRPGEFIVEFEVEESPQQAQYGPRARYFRLLSAEDREELRGIQNEMIAASPRFDPVALQALQNWQRWVVDQWFEPISEPYPPDEDVWMRYTTEADLRRWLGWLTPRLPVLAARFEAAPDQYDHLADDLRVFEP